MSCFWKPLHPARLSLGTHASYDACRPRPHRWALVGAGGRWLRGQKLRPVASKSGWRCSSDPSSSCCFLLPNSWVLAAWAEEQKRSASEESWLEMLSSSSNLCFVVPVGCSAGPVLLYCPALRVTDTEPTNLALSGVGPDASFGPDAAAAEGVAAPARLCSGCSKPQPAASGAGGVDSMKIAIAMPENHAHPLTQASSETDRYPYMTTNGQPLKLPRHARLRAGDGLLDTCLKR